MALTDFLRRKEPLLAVDIGSSALKILEFDFVNGQPNVINLGYAEYDSPVFAGFLINKPDKVAETFKKLMEASGMSDRRLAMALPSSCVFSKRIKIPKMAVRDLDSNVRFEAARYLPDKIETLRMDYHILGEVGNNYEVLLAAVKNEIVDSYMAALLMIGLQTAVMDIESFALQNCFEMAHPEYLEQACLLVHMGARGCALNLCQGGNSLFADNISIGGKSFTDAIMLATKLDFQKSESLKKQPEELRRNQVAWEACLKKMQDFAAQLNRQITLMKGASGLSRPIDRILIAGGGVRLPEFSRIIKEQTSIDTQFLGVAKSLQLSDNIDRAYLEHLEPFLAVVAGLTVRQPGDKNIL